MIQSQVPQTGRSPYLSTSGKVGQASQERELFGPCIDGSLDGLSSGTHVAATVTGGYGHQVGIAKGARLTVARSL